MVKTWEVRNMGEADCAAASKAARESGKSVAEWVSEAIRAKVNEGRWPKAIEVVQTSANGHGDRRLDLALQVLAVPAAQKWLRAGAARLLGGELGIEDPKLQARVRRRLAAPNALDSGEGEGPPAKAAEDEGVWGSRTGSPIEA